MIIVCPYSAVQALVAQHKVAHVVSLLAPETEHLTIASIDQRRHLRLTFHDIIEEMEGLVTPQPRDSEKLIRFVDEWDRADPMLIHCWAGISRSMASAFTVLCDRLGPGREIEIARAMRRRAPHAAPNTLLVAHADAALGRGGAMIAALNTMGPARMVEEGALTDLPLVGL